MPLTKIGAYSFTASEVLFARVPQAYAAECKTFRAESFEVIDRTADDPAGEANV
jgi:hypothetical protein